MKYILLLALLCSCASTFAQQQQDTIPAAAPDITASDTAELGELRRALLDTLPILDSNSVKSKVFIPVPKKAALYALALPGAGQIYNRDWWKLPLVYGAVGGMVYAIDYNTSWYKRFRDALVLERAGMPHEFDNFSIGNEQALLNQRNTFDKNRQLSYVGLVLVYALTAMEAFVDAHLRNFDIEDNLTSIELKPQFELLPVTGQPTLGIGISIPLGTANTTAPPPASFQWK